MADEAIGDEQAAAAHYTSQGQAFLRESQTDGDGDGPTAHDDKGEGWKRKAVGAFELAVGLAPGVCEYEYWLADAMHQVSSLQAHAICRCL